VGWIVIKVIEKAKGKDSLSASDRKWLEDE
jgi:hypothetical protein